jgi:uncharacterized protein (DUF488 family)
MSLEQLEAALRGHGIDRVADVRRYPASRRHPQFNHETLAEYLVARRIEYRWFEELGGRRGRTIGASPNRGIRIPAFRHYADYMQTPEFQRAFDELVAWMREGRTALLCAEKLWWRCHRRLISDLLVARGGTVRHILAAESAEEHALWELAVTTPEGVVYPPEQGELDLGRSRRRGTTGSSS